MGARKWVSVEIACGTCTLVFDVSSAWKGETERFKVTLGLVSDCSVALAADKGTSLHLPLWVPLKSHTVPVFFRQETNVFVE